MTEQMTSAASIPDRSGVVHHHDFNSAVTVTGLVQTLAVEIAPYPGSTHYIPRSSATVVDELLPKVQHVDAR